MKTRYDDRIFNFPLPPTATGETPGVRLTRRSVMGLVAAGALAGFPRTARAGFCSTGAFAHEIALTSLSFFPDGNTLISAGLDSLVKFWTIPDGALFRSLATDAVPVQVAVSPNGNRIAVAMQSGHLELWSADGGTRRQLAGHTDTVNGVAFSPDSSQLVSVSQDRTTKIWSVADAKLLRSFSDGSVMDEVAVPPSARAPARGRATPRLLVTSGAQLELRSLSNGAVLQTAAGQPFAISPNGQVLAAHDAARLYLYAFPSLTPLVKVTENLSAAALSFSADGKLLAIVYANAAPRLYSAPDLTLLVELQAAGGPSVSAAMDPQNRYLAVASGKNLDLYALPSGEPVPVCFMDIAASSPAASGLQYITGGAVYTLACGESLPLGFGCYCDCVPGDCPCVNDTGCACDSDTGCSCDSDTGCSCNSNTGCSCVGDVGCSCVSDYGCGCVDDSGCGCDGDVGCGCDGDLGPANL